MLEGNPDAVYAAVYAAMGEARVGQRRSLASAEEIFQASISGCRQTVAVLLMEMAEGYMFCIIGVDGHLS